MRKFLLKFFIAITVLIFLPIIYLSTIGIETESFNEQIKNKVNESNKNLQLNLKKIKIKLDPLRLKFNAKTFGATVYYYNKPLELEYIGTEVSLASIIKKKFVSSNLEIGSKSLPLGDLIKFARTAYKGPELFILEKNYREAALIFAEGFQKFPDSIKAAEMLFKLSQSLYQVEKTTEACKTMEKLIIDFPKNKIIPQTKKQIVDYNCLENNE